MQPHAVNAKLNIFQNIQNWLNDSTAAPLKQTHCTGCKLWELTEKLVVIMPYFNSADRRKREAHMDTPPFADMSVFQSFLASHITTRNKLKDRTSQWPRVSNPRSKH